MTLVPTANHVINTYLAERSRPLVLAQEKPCVCHSSEDRRDKGCLGGVHVNTTMVRLGAQVYVCLYSVWGREVGITVLCVLGGPSHLSLCPHW